MEVCGDEAGGVWFAGLEVCVEAVDVVASEGGHFDSVDEFCGA